MKFLVDECLSPKLVELALDRGYADSTHVSWRGLAGMQDWNLITYVVEGDWTFVTKNSVDFRGATEEPGEGGEYQRADIHAGLVCLNGDDMDRAMQVELFEAVLDDLQGDGDLVCKCIEASMQGNGTIEVVRYSLPAQAA